MAEGSVSFGIALDVDGAQDVDSAALSVEDLGRRLQADTRELRAMQSALRNLKGSTNVAADTVQNLRDKIAIHKIVIAETQGKYIELGGTFRAAARGAKAFGDASQSSASQQAAAASSAASAMDRLKASAASANTKILQSAQIADQSSFSLARLEGQIVRDQHATNQLKGAMTELGPRTDVNAEAFDNLSLRIKAHTEALSFAKSRYSTAGGSLDTLRDRMKRAGSAGGEFSERLFRMSEAGALIPGPIGAATTQLGAMRALLQGGAIAGVLGITAAIVALTAVIIASTVALAAWGFSLASARREQKLTHEAMIATNKTLKGQTDTAATLSGSIQDVANDTGLARGEAEKYAAALYKGGLRGTALDKALRGAAISAVAAGDSQAQAFIKSARAARGSGAAIDNLVNKVENKLGRIATAKALGFSNQMAKLRENVGLIFSGLRIDGFLRELTKVTSLFHEGSAVSDALKSTFELLFQPLVDGAGGAMPTIRRLIQYMIIGGLHVNIAWLKVRNTLRDAIKGTFLEKLLTAENLTTTLKWAAIGLASIVGGVLVLGITSFVTLLAPMVALLAGVTIAFSKVAEGVAWVVTNWGNLGAALAETDFGKAANRIIDGLVNGIKNGYGRVVSAVKGLAKAVFSGFNDEAEIKSPSRKAIRATAFIGEGAAIGLQRSKPRVAREARGLADVSAQLRPSTQPGRPAPRPQPVGASVGFSLADLVPATLRAPQPTQPPRPAPAAPAAAPRPTSLQSFIRSSAPKAPSLPAVQPVPAPKPPKIEIQSADPAPLRDTPRDDSRDPGNPPAPAAPPAPTAPPVPAKQPGAPPAGTSVTYSIGDLHIHIGDPGNKNAEDMANDVIEALQAKLEAIAAGMGAA